MSRNDDDKKSNFSANVNGAEEYEYHWHNYWDEWHHHEHHHEHHHDHHGNDFHEGEIPSPDDLAEWREFFYQLFGVWPERHWIFGGRRFGPWQQGLDTFNPFVATLLSKGGGLLPLYVLHLVAQKPRYGNEIMDILAKRTNGQWVSNPGAIYPLLTLLEHEGFIHGEWADPSKRTVRTYTITATGKNELDRIKGVVGPKLEETIKILELFMQDLQDQSPSSASAEASAEA